MPVPFGISIGDFIAFIETTIKIVNALQDSKGARKDYEDIARELKSLKHALAGVQDVNTDDPQTKAALESVAGNCWRTIQDFLKKTKKYDSSLGSTNSSNRWKDGLRKIQWALYSKEDVQKFRWQLYSHTASLILLLEQVNRATAAAAQRNQSDALIRIEAKIDTQRKQSAAIQAMVISTVLRCWKEFQLVTALILSHNFRMFNLVANGSSLPRQPSFEQPVKFQDAHGRVLPIQVAWIDTWNHFETMLKWKFSTVPGLGKIERGEYILSDSFGKRDLDQTKPIQSRCPKCDCEVLESSDLDNHCEVCGLWYSRFKVSATARGSDDDPSLDFEYLSIAEPSLYGPSPKRRITTNVDIVSDFSRVRIVELEDQQHEGDIKSANDMLNRQDANDEEDVESGEHDKQQVTEETEVQSVQEQVPKDADTQESTTTYPKVHRDHLSEDTLHYYNLPYEYDSVPSLLQKKRQRTTEQESGMTTSPPDLREDVLKLPSFKAIPPNARWTKIDRRLVNPECLEEANEKFEERVDCVIVLRVLTRDEIQRYADRTKEIRDKRYNEENWDDISTDSSIDNP
ncbi:MAG: hypothetical protein M1822_004922 [Bathelium mastoideum]|nr:MAG: hypothetical protein M1822_004922 [Bathelium mastoideum]